MKTLEQACVPRRSVFEERGADTVYSVEDLPTIDPTKFFAENFVTDGMRQLLTEAFRRLEGKSDSAAGAFLLSQAMGGGKTHNLVALGLLAAHPELRAPVMSGFYQPGPLGPVQVVTFTGRKTHTPFGIWGELAEQMGKKDAFRDFYSPLQAPDPAAWVNLLAGPPVLLLLDELPPYFEAMKAIAVGDTFLDRLTTAALSNLLVAVSSGKLPNVCVVMTDLSGSAYGQGSATMSEALADFQREAGRSVPAISPVRINSNELYQILRTRLFESVPGVDEIEEIADSYRQEVDRARLMDMTAASPEQLRSDIVASYPFHPAIRDLYARFRENPGFQQTRALIRIMRLVVGDLWTSGAAKTQFLIGAQDFDLHAPDMLSEIRQINSHLDNAVAHDIADEGRSSVAERIDGPGGRDAQDVCKLLFLSSLSLAMNPTLGLDRSEIAAYLAAPNRDLSTLRNAIDRVQSEAWYVHPTRDAKLVFRPTENLIAKLDSYTSSQLREQREATLRTRLLEMFRPVKRDCYQEVKALPALDQVQTSQDNVVLVIFKPGANALEEIRQYWEAQQFKNRLLFLSGAEAEYETVLQRAAELGAANLILKELIDDNRREDDPQRQDAQSIVTKKESQFYLACRETFQTLYYPHQKGLVPLDLDPKYVANEYKGEEQVTQALKEVAKFREDTDANGTFRNTLENKLWPPEQKEVAWAEVKRRAAADPSWLLHHPRALDALKDELIRRDIWRDSGGGFVQRGPFPKAATSVQVQPLSRDDGTGEATLRVKPLHGDTVYWSESGPATTASTKLDGGENFKTKAVRLSFLAVDSTGEHDTGEPVTWTNTITVRHRFFQDGDVRRCELQAVPTGAIKYTTDGSSPENSGATYTSPFVVPATDRFVLAIAEADGVKSPLAKFDIPRDKGETVVSVNALTPATWKRKFRRDSTGESYEWLQLAQNYRATLGGLKLTAMRDTRWVQFAADTEVALSPEAATEEANKLRDFVPQANIDLEVDQLQFPTGQDLLDMVSALKTELQPGEVIQ